MFSLLARSPNIAGKYLNVYFHEMAVLTWKRALRGPARVGYTSAIEGFHGKLAGNIVSTSSIDKDKGPTFFCNS